MTTKHRPLRRAFLKGAAATTTALAAGFPLLATGATLHKLRIATLAPDGSSWHKALKQMARQVKRRTKGAVELAIYAGGTMGDEPAMIRKMRTGQLDGAAVTNVGLGEINKQLLMLKLPLLFRGYDDVDRVRDAMSDKFEALLQAEGFRISGWGDVGFSYLFSSAPIKRPEDLKKTKMWSWSADPVGTELMKVAGVNAVSLEAPDVMASLQTGLVDGFSSSPYGAIAMQWYTKARYVTDLRLGMTIGGSVLREESWAKLSDQHKLVVDDVFKGVHRKLIRKVRSANAKALGVLINKGITKVKPEAFAAWKSLAEQVRENLTGSVFDASLVNEMLGHL